VSVLGVALLTLLPGAAIGAPRALAAPADFGNRHLVRHGFFSELAEAVDANGKVHLAAGNERDIWYATNRTGSWTSTKVFAHVDGPDGFFWGQPSIAVDGNNRVHIVATRFPHATGGEGIFYASDAGHAPGTFGNPTRIANSRYGEPQLQVYAGHLYLVAVRDWCCAGNGTVVLRTNKSGSWTTATVGVGQSPSFRMTSDGYARVVFERDGGAPGLYFGVAGTHKGNFTTAHIPGTNTYDGSALLALVNNQAQITWRHFTAVPGSWRFTYATNSGWHSFLTVPGSNANMTAATGATSTGFAHIALAGTNVTDHYRCGSEPPFSWCDESVAPNVHATAVALAGGPSFAIDIAWIQSGDIWYATQKFPGP
jgi:hypothetical protein